MLSEDLKQITALVEVDEDVVPLQHVDVLGHLGPHLLEPLPHAHVVRIWDREEVDAAFPQAIDHFDDVVGTERDMLAACAVVVVTESVPLVYIPEESDVNRG